jgi:hypothetical protein
MLEGELESELEQEFQETQGEGEGILGAIGNVLGGLLGEGEAEQELSETQGEGEGILGTIGNVLGGLLGEGEAEQEAEMSELEQGEAQEFEMEGIPEAELQSEVLQEGEAELEYELNPVRKIYSDALMEHLAHVASEAESEQEAAEGFLPLIPLVASKLLPVAAKLGARALPQVTRALSRVTPQLTRSISTLTRGLFRNPRTRPLVRAVPRIARSAVATIAKQAATGRQVTPQMARRVIYQKANQVLKNPRRRAVTVQRSGAVDRRFHRISAVPMRPRLCPSCGGAAMVRRRACRACGHLLNLSVRF